MKKIYIPGPEEIAQKWYMIIPNLFFDEIMPNLDPEAWMIVSYFIRKTYGFHQARYSIGLIQLSSELPISYGTVQDRLKRLTDSGILVITKEHDRHNGKTREYRLIQGDFYI